MIRREDKKISSLFIKRSEDLNRSIKAMQKALEYRLEFEKLIASISAQFISLKVDKINAALEESFQQICEFADVDRGYIFWYTDVLGRHMEKIHEWCQEGIPPMLNRITHLDMSMFPYLDCKIKHLEPFFTHSVEDLPREAEAERQEFSSQKVQSLIFVPMIYEGKAIGFVGFETVKSKVFWSEDSIALLKLVSEIFVNALERIRSDKVIRQSEERYALIARGVNDGLWDWNLKTNQIFYSTRWKAMLGYEEHEVSDTLEEWLKRVHPEDHEKVTRQLNEHLAGLTDHYESQHRMQHKNGTYRWVRTRGIGVQDEKGRVWRMAGSQTDITDRIEFEEKLRQSALHDSLTGLPNRDMFLERLHLSVLRAKTVPGYFFAVLFMDLDRFKTINDSFGHLFGDELIVAVSRRIRTCIQSNHMLARLGGDEFTVLLENIRGQEEAVWAAEAIQKKLADPFTVQGQTIATSASIGIALSSSLDIKNESDVLRSADTALNRAKAIRKGCHVIYNETMHAQVIETLKLETDLRKALQMKQLEVYYQPIMAIQTGIIRGFEALARWVHPERGMISPVLFIPIAEETGLVIPIGRWVLREACRQAAEWPRYSRKHLSVSVNLSAKQFLDPGLVDEVERALKDSRLDPSRLDLEITESVFLEDSELALDVLGHLRDLHVKLHLDDFGTGYSSLSYLHRFQLDALKIDRSFINQIGRKGENSAIAKTIVSLARNMNMEVVAEGIETTEQLQFLRSIGCEYGQGFYYARPLTRQASCAFVSSD